MLIDNRRINLSFIDNNLDDIRHPFLELRFSQRIRQLRMGEL